jgi:pyridinium-3,5-biscarboxylic acid mononucleotide synthase
VRRREREVDLGYARLDLERPERCGLHEAVFCPGKTPRQIADILRTLRDKERHALATRADEELFRAVSVDLPDAVYHPAARCITLDAGPLPRPTGRVAVVTAGTSDIPVAEEACLAAERLGARVERVYDVGVAGLHRLLGRLNLLRRARVVIVAAGMDGALPSVVGGLVACPVIAVPTSVGYGAHFGGIAALLTMLNSCAAGVMAVNIDNGFGAGVAAALINRHR